MTARGVLFAITGKDLAALEALDDADAVVEYIVEVIEERWEAGFVFELDKAWDTRHRCFADGSLEQNAGAFPLNATVLGRETLDAGPDYFVGLTRASDVPVVAVALRDIDDRWIADAYRTNLPLDDAPGNGAEDLQYTVECFDGLSAFWRTAAESGRSVLFTVDQ